MIYIKDMDMPIDCLACRIACDKESYMVIGRPPKCPLAEAPDGDFIGRAETIEAVEQMEIFLGERKKNAVIRGIQALPSADAKDCTDFLLWLLEEIMDEENWELNAVADGEIIARKLKKLGLLQVKNGYYVRTGLTEALSAEAVQGEWEHWGSPFSDESEVIDTIVCSVCGARFIEPKDETKGEYNYCPNCGAKMKGGDDE